MLKVADSASYKDPHVPAHPLAHPIRPLHYPTATPKRCSNQQGDSVLSRLLTAPGLGCMCRVGSLVPSSSRCFPESAEWNTLDLKCCRILTEKETQGERPETEARSWRAVACWWSQLPREMARYVWGLNGGFRRLCSFKRHCGPPCCSSRISCCDTVSTTERTSEHFQTLTKKQGLTAEDLLSSHAFRHRFPVVNGIFCADTTPRKLRPASEIDSFYITFTEQNRQSSKTENLGHGFDLGGPSNLTVARLSL